MKINCQIDGNPYSIIANADKPLNLILQERSESYCINNSCLHSECGNCLIIFNQMCIPACLIPAFKANGANIQTFEGFRKTRFYHDIERTYAKLGISPCRQCYPSKTLLIEFLVSRLDKISVSFTQSKDKEQNLSHEFIKREMSINKCECLDLMQIEKIVQTAYEYRRRRSVKKH